MYLPLNSGILKRISLELTHIGKPKARHNFNFVIEKHVPAKLADIANKNSQFMQRRQDLYLLQCYTWQQCDNNLPLLMSPWLKSSSSPSLHFIFFLQFLSRIKYLLFPILANYQFQPSMMGIVQCNTAGLGGDVHMDDVWSWFSFLCLVHFKDERWMSKMDPVDLFILLYWKRQFDSQKKSCFGNYSSCLYYCFIKLNFIDHGMFGKFTNQYGQGVSEEAGRGKTHCCIE